EQEEEEGNEVVVLPSEDNDDSSEDGVVVGGSDETKPQTGDESSMAMYVYILIGSIVLIAIALFGVFRKKATKAGFTALVLLVASAVLLGNANGANADSAVYEQSISKTYNVEIEGEDYEYVV